jgi:hypothetical protein
VIQQAVLQRLQPQWDPTFSEHSYGFRPVAITGSGWDPELLRLELGELAVAGTRLGAPFQLALGQIGAALAKSEALLRGEQVRLVLAVDQLEELFTDPAITPAERERFVPLLAGLLLGHSASHSERLFLPRSGHPRPMAGSGGFLSLRVVRASDPRAPRDDSQIGTSLGRTDALHDVERRDRTAKTL